MLAWTDCLGCACPLQRKGLDTRQGQAYPVPAGEGPSLMEPLDPTHAVSGRWRARVRSELGAGAPARSRRQACLCPSHSGVLSARLVPSVCGTLPPREGGLHDRMTDGVSMLMPWRSSFPCHRMCCGPDTPLWFALSLIRIADMIAIDRHVSFLHKSIENNNDEKRPVQSVEGLLEVQE